MPDNPSHAGAPPPCPRPCQKPQLNTTVAGRYSGCGTCICGGTDGDGGSSSKDSAQITQPSSNMDELQHRASVQLNIDGAVKCCHCCGQRPEHLLGLPVDSPKAKSAPPSVIASRRRRRGPGPWDVLPNGDFILRNQDWQSSTDGGFSYRFSLELRYNNTRCPSMATQAPTTDILSSQSCPVIAANGGSHSPGEVHDQAGEWIDQDFKNGQYFCGCPSRTGDPSSHGALSELLMGNSEMQHSPYPANLRDEDFC
ncbi:hypothetical protein NA57DRAFT_55297 [Rhizodiscina lignyota]|uniref:Uncharacterized protein n=1 Tax=Rhizodiscina lignyota TaxID=1504668 RepID=A0A9P4M636_9PEZI|nr:hypothetical protein NA57DRAFT_55297 [Rhizodiscina lignyota]